MTPLTQFEFLRALGSALFDSLWQFGLVWVLFRLLVVPLKYLSAALKHGILIFLLSISTFWFIGTLLNAYINGKEYYDALASSDSASGSGTWSYVTDLVEARLPILAAAYLLIVAALFVRLGSYFIYARKIQTNQLEKPAADLRLQVKKLAERLGLTKNVGFWISGLIDTPMIIGFLKPTILLPLASVNQLSVSQLEAILLHELAHIKRNDYLLNIYVSSLKIIFFFNPFCRLLIESVRQEREKSCDDWVLQFRFDPHQYASALFQLESVRSARYSLGIAAGGSSKTFLLERIERILSVKSKRKTNRIQLAGYFLVLGLIATSAMLMPVKTIERGSNKSVVASGYRLFKAVSDGGLISQTASRGLIPVINRENPIVITNSPETSVAAVDDEPDIQQPDDVERSERIIQVSNTTVDNIEDVREFSIHTPNAPETPVNTEDPAAPFVPNSSFSFHIVEDTTQPKVKEESYSEHAAKESLVKAKKALAQVDWDKIQIELVKKGKLTKANLLKQLEASLDKLNWTEINNEVSATLNKQSVDKWRASLKTELDDAAKYKELQQQFQLLKDQLQQQQQLLKKEAEIESIKLDKEIKKNKVIVHL